MLPERIKGMAYAALSAVIFGFTPILGRLTYPMGSNGITLTFLRATLCLPVLLLLVKAKGISLRLERREIGPVILLGSLGCALTTVLLYLSYDYQPVGLSTTLHFIYPAVIAAGCVVLFKEHLGVWKLLAVVLSMAGVLLFIDLGSSGSALGFALALLSGVTYAFYVIYMDWSGLKKLHYFKLSFYVCCCMSLCTGLFGVVSGQLVLVLPPEAWVLSLMVSFFTSLGALPLFQLGVRYTGASTAAVLSTLEPITSIAVGILVLGEELSVFKWVGCVLILAGVVLVSACGGGKSACPDE